MENGQIEETPRYEELRDAVEALVCDRCGESTEACDCPVCEKCGERIEECVCEWCEECDRDADECVCPITCDGCGRTVKPTADCECSKSDDNEEVEF